MQAIQLFFFTDHGAFDLDLYEKTVALLGQSEYDGFASVLPGVEFTVKLEKGTIRCTWWPYLTPERTAGMTHGEKTRAD